MKVIRDSKSGAVLFNDANKYNEIKNRKMLAIKERKEKNKIMLALLKINELEERIVQLEKSLTKGSKK